MDPLGLKPLEAKAATDASAIEAKTAADVNAIEDKFLAAVLPEIQALRVELANGLQQLATIAQNAIDLAERYGSVQILTTLHLPPKKA